MFSHRSFLMLGDGAADILSLIKGGYEISNSRFRSSRVSIRRDVHRRGFIVERFTWYCLSCHPSLYWNGLWNPVNITMG